MEVAPRVEMKPFAGCQPGELVRVLWDGKCCLSLVAARGEQRHLLVLSSDRHERDALPRYATVSDRDFDTALSYGRDYEVEIDHSGPVGIGSGGEPWEKAGSIALTGTSWLLYVPSFQGQRLRDGSRPPPIYWDLSNWTAAPWFQDNRTVATFGKWAIYQKQPEGAIQRSPPLFEHGGAPRDRG